MKLEWKDNGANVGRLELRVRRSDYTGKWNTMVFFGLNQIGSHHDFETDAAARAWCEEWVESLVVGPLLATARAEAALAEREACVSALDAEIAALEALGDERDERGTTVVGWRIKSVRAVHDRIRARTAPATLSADTLAAIAEARGLRVVEPEYLAELEAAAKDASAAAMAEREACAVHLEESARTLDTIAAGLVAGSMLRLDLEKAAEVLRTTAGGLRARGENGGAK